MSYSTLVPSGYEFSQSVLLDKYKDKSVNDGICLALVSLYLTGVKDKVGMAHRAYKTFRTQYSDLVTPNVQYSKPTKKFAHAAEIQKTYSKDFGGGIDQIDAATAMKDASNGTLFLGKRYDYTAEIMSGKIRAAIKKEPIVMLTFSCAGGAHAVGVAVDTTEKLVLVFDPNYGAGVTTISDAGVDDFFDLIIGELVKTYTISKGWASACVH